MTKYKQYLLDMLTQNKSIFDEFLQIHNHYLLDPKPNQEEFNRIGRDIQDIIRRYENRLCSKSESSGYGKFSSKLSENFQKEIKKYFPKIDFIGVE